jgi:hypothetical protein
MTARNSTLVALTPEQRFWAYVDVSGDCWEWQGARGSKGYGAFQLRTRQETAHRVAWRLHFGPIPEGLFVCHSCDNPPCVNPAHLFLGTPADNAADREVKGRRKSLVGERHQNAKLTWADVCEVRRLYADGLLQRQIAERFGVTQPLVSMILSGRSRVAA